jgi:hypothetical protein
MVSLRNRLIRLAHDKRELRKDLLPLLRTAAKMPPGLYEEIVDGLKRQGFKPGIRRGEWVHTPDWSDEEIVVGFVPHKPTDLLRLRFPGRGNQEFSARTEKGARKLIQQFFGRIEDAQTQPPPPPVDIMDSTYMVEAPEGTTIVGKLRGKPAIRLVKTDHSFHWRLESVTRKGTFPYTLIQDWKENGMSLELEG